MRACLLALILASSFTSVALAEDPVPSVSPRTRIIRMPDTPIVGRRQLPIAVFLSRSPMRYRAPELERHATDAIVESVTHPPF